MDRTPITPTNGQVTPKREDLSNQKPQVKDMPASQLPVVTTPCPASLPATCLCRVTVDQRLPCHCGSAVGPRADTVRAICSLTSADPLVKLLTMTTLPLGEVKTHLSELVGRVHDHHERVTVTVHGRPSAVLVAVEDLERLEETLAIMRDADTMRRLAASDAELARGEEVTAAEIAETIRNRSAHG